MNHIEVKYRITNRTLVRPFGFPTLRYRISGFGSPLDLSLEDFGKVELPPIQGFCRFVVDLDRGQDNDWIHSHYIQLVNSH